MKKIIKCIKLKCKLYETFTFNSVKLITKSYICKPSS